MQQWFKNIFQSGNKTVNQIVAINLVVFLLIALANVILWFAGKPAGFADSFARYLMLPLSAGKFVYQPWSILSFAFVHTGLLHVVVNMLVFYWVGNLFLDFNKSLRLWFFYVGGSICGAVLAMLFYSFIPAIQQSVSVAFLSGSSAGTLALLVGIVVMVPQYEVMLFGAFRVRLLYLVFGYLVFNLITIPAGNSAGLISHFGGAGAGWLFMSQVIKRGKLLFIFTQIFNMFDTSLKRKVPMTVTYRKTVSNKADDKPSQEAIDTVLEKITESGYESLTQKEKDILFKASKPD